MREDPETAHSARFIFRFYRLVLLMCPLEERYIIVTKRKSYLLVCDIPYVRSKPPRKSNSAKKLRISNKTKHSCVSVVSVTVVEAFFLT